MVSSVFSHAFSLLGSTLLTFQWHQIGQNAKYSSDDASSPWFRILWRWFSLLSMKIICLRSTAFSSKILTSRSPSGGPNVNWNEVQQIVDRWHVNFHLVYQIQWYAVRVLLSNDPICADCIAIRGRDSSVATRNVIGINVRIGLLVITKVINWGSIELSGPYSEYNSNRSRVISSSIRYIRNRKDGPLLPFAPFSN